jgi:pimeloyl-ACP methyl ester carboxylesterase
LQTLQTAIELYERCSILRHNIIYDKKGVVMISGKSSIKILAVLSVILAIAGARYQYMASKQDEKKYQPVGKMIDVGGYKLHMIDSHIGKATVVIDSGIGIKTLDWCLVQPEIAKFARVVTYDRAGYAWSDASPRERTAENIVQELHTLLHNAKIPAPYILVGDAFGATNMHLFATKYRQEVAGLILINEGLQDLPSWSTNPLFLYLMDIASYCGLLRIVHCIPSVAKKNHDAIAAYPQYLQNIYDTQTMTTKYVGATMQEKLHLKKSCNQLKSQDALLGNVPLMILTSAQIFNDEQLKDENFAEQQKVWQAAQAQLVHASSQGQQMLIASCKNIAVEQPCIVIDVVRNMVNQLGAGKVR